MLVTSAVCDDGRVVHFPLAVSAPGISVANNWHAMGMRATGSHDVVIDRVFVPRESVSLERPRGQWHPFFNVTVIVALPLVMSVYLGVAEAARDVAVQHVQRKRDDPNVWYLVGELDSLLVSAQLAVESMQALCADYEFAPDVATANAVLIRKTLAAQAVLAVAEKALEAVGGQGLFRTLPPERLVRDVHGAQFHPLPAKRQHRLSGRVALGLNPAD
jgi:alkylation response protein AidB-like acyl-CoA dehydrogenase